MFSVVYTPTEGDAIQNFSRLFRRPEGCFLNINYIDRVSHDLAQWGNPDDIDYIVVSGKQSRFTHPSAIIGTKLRGKTRETQAG